jgi:hypothetical protein
MPATRRAVHGIPRDRARDFLVSETGGLIFSAFFRKKDGSMREMVCRRGVTAHRRGGDLPYDPLKHGLITVFDMEKNDYRMVNSNTLVSFNIHGETFIISD